MDDFRGLDPFFRIIEQGLAGSVDGERFFDLLADEVVSTSSSPSRTTHAVSSGATI
ncbi:MAG: hypothetical protein WBZ37_01130 [Mycobacterium sp.]